MLAVALAEGCETPPAAVEVVDEVPEVEITAPEDGEKRNAPEVTFEGTATDAEGPVHAQWRLDGGPAQELALDLDGAFEFSLVLAQGSHDVTVEATDDAGQTASDRVTVTYLGKPPEDGAAPKVKLLAPSAGVLLHDPFVVVVGTATDDAGVTWLTWSLDGGLEEDVTSELESDGGFSFEVPLEDGEHTIVVRAHDAAGKQGTAWVEVTVAAGGLGGR